MSSEALLGQEEHESDEPSAGLLRHTELKKMEARSEHQKVRMYQSLYAFTTCIGVGLTLLVLVWIVHYRDGFAGTSNPSQEFYWHPFLMVLGMIFLYSQSILAYRTGRQFPKKWLKWLHGSLHGLAFILSVIGLKTVFDSHNLPKVPIPNLYTMHSWIGLTTVIIFACQYLVGFIAFLFPGLSSTLRKVLMPVHVAVGTGGFVLAIVSVCTGLTEKTIWTLGKSYGSLPTEGVLLNFIAVFTVLYGVLVLYLVNETMFKRVPLPEDEIALVGTD